MAGSDITMTPEEMRALEANSDYFGVTYLDLMENAGKKVAESIMSRFRRCAILVVCGTGNNGGDGFVVARYLARAKYSVFVLLLGRKADVRKGPALANLERLDGAGVEVSEAPDAENIMPEIFDACAVIVDAILGTGASGEIREPARTAIGLINKSPAVKISVDLPSGMRPDGSCDLCVEPDLVITFHALKPGLDRYNHEAVDIGIPEKAYMFVGPGQLLSLKARGDFTHKGQSGRVLVVGGGPYTGAPALAAMAALRAGADIVTVAAPSRAADIIASYSPNLITFPLKEKNRITLEDVPGLESLAKRHDTVVMGMGAGSDVETLKALAELVNVSGRVVMDADVLRPEMPLKGIVTPHRGELARLRGADEAADDNLVGAMVKDFSKARSVTTVLKGKVDIVSDGMAIKYNATGNAGMTVGGTGDVLAGIAGAFYCKNDAFLAACAAAFISGAAGDLAFEERGYGIVATDVVEKIPLAMKKYRQRK